MRADTQHTGLGVGPNPQPTPGDCPHCDSPMDVAERMNDTTDQIITSFVYECPECEARFIDQV